MKYVITWQHVHLCICTIFAVWSGPSLPIGRLANYNHSMQDAINKMAAASMLFLLRYKSSLNCNTKNSRVVLQVTYLWPDIYACLKFCNIIPSGLRIMLQTQKSVAEDATDMVWQRQVESIPRLSYGGYNYYFISGCPPTLHLSSLVTYRSSHVTSVTGQVNPSRTASSFIDKTQPTLPSICKAPVYPDKISIIQKSVGVTVTGGDNRFNMQPLRPPWV